MDVRILETVKYSRFFKGLEKDLEKETSQTYLFLSEDEILTQAVLTLVECKIYCPDVCLTCPECRKVLNKNKLDVVDVNPDGESIPVNEMREKLVNDSYVSSVEGGKKIYVIRNFSELNINNQNVLLKTLEEPPEKVMILLSSISTEGILPTVLSRVSKIDIPPLDAPTLIALLKKLKVEFPEDTAYCARGNLSLALKIASSESFSQKVNQIADILINVKRSADVPKYLYADVWEDLSETLFYLERILGDLLYLTAELEENITIRELKEKYFELIRELDKNAIASLMEEVNSAEKKLKANCNKTNVVDCLLLKLAEEKAKCKKLSV